MRFVRALVDGEIVALMVDQHAVRGGRVAVQFFGRPAWATKSVAMLHLTTRAPVLLACAVRLRPLRYALQVVGPVTVERTGDRDEGRGGPDAGPHRGDRGRRPPIPRAIHVGPPPVADAARSHLVTAAWPTFSLLFFASEPAAFQRGKFDLFRESTRFADRHGFEAVWIPERHFHAFGGIFPNPALAGVVLAETTERIRIRAGSVVMPLHHPDPRGRGVGRGRQPVRRPGRRVVRHRLESRTTSPWRRRPTPTASSARSRASRSCAGSGGARASRRRTAWARPRACSSIRCRARRTSPSG